MQAYDVVVVVFVLGGVGVGDGKMLVV